MGGIMYHVALVERRLSGIMYHVALVERRLWVV